MFIGVMILPVISFVLIFLSFKIDNENMPLKLIFFFSGLLMSVSSLGIVKTLAVDLSSYELITFLYLITIASFGFTFFYYLAKYLWEMTDLLERLGKKLF